MTISQFALNVASSGAAAALGGFSLAYLVRPLYRRYTLRRPLRRVLCIPNGRRPIVVHSAVRNLDHDEYYAFTVTPDCLAGHHEIQSKLAALGIALKDNSYRFPDTISDTERSQDLILIGGYENNSVSREVSSELDHVRMKDNKIYVAGRDEPYDIVLSDSVTEQNKKKIIKDYCIISRRCNPYAHDKVIISFEGIRHFGTEAGIRFLTPRNLKNKVFKDLEKAHELYIIISCGVSHFGHGNFQLKNLNLEYVWCDGSERDVAKWVGK